LAVDADGQVIDAGGEEDEAIGRAGLADLVDGGVGVGGGSDLGEGGREEGQVDGAAQLVAVGMVELELAALIFAPPGEGAGRGEDVPGEGAQAGALAQLVEDLAVGDVAEIFGGGGVVGDEGDLHGGIPRSAGWAAVAITLIIPHGGIPPCGITRRSRPARGRAWRGGGRWRGRHR
jgi:hypothetical protein